MQNALVVLLVARGAQAVTLVAHLRSCAGGSRGSARSRCSPARRPDGSSGGPRALLVASVAQAVTLVARPVASQLSKWSS
eukprot:6109688-Pyramimonas_sp.AAC.1